MGKNFNKEGCAPLSLPRNQPYLQTLVNLFIERVCNGADDFHKESFGRVASI